MYVLYMNYCESAQSPGSDSKCDDLLLESCYPPPPSFMKIVPVVFPFIRLTQQSYQTKNITSCGGYKKYIRFTIININITFSL